MRWLTALIVVAATSCAQPPMPDLVTLPSLDRCGLFAAQDYRASAEDRDNPRACELPSAEQLAQSCAIHDQINAPDYDPQYDDEGNITNFTPLPKYGVVEAKCEFTDAKHNRAACQFALTVPDEAEPMAASVTLRHKYWRDDGPTHHMMGTMWYLDKGCRPDAVR